MPILRHNIAKSGWTRMTDTVKPTHTRACHATARNTSGLLIDPLDAQHIVGVAETSLPDGMPVIAARVSFDGGGSWRESWPLPVETEWAGLVGPVLAMDARGVVNLAALALHADRSSASLVVYRSEDGGIQWGRPKPVLEGAAECCYSIAADLRPASPFRGSVYIAADMDNVLSFARSSDGCRWNGRGHWRPGPLLKGLCFNPEVLVDAEGSVHLMWMSGPSGCRVLAACSADGGQTFCAPVTVAQGIVGVHEGLPETAPSTCFADDGVALCVWADDREGRARIYRSRSLDWGRTWQGPLEGEPLAPGDGAGQHEFQPHPIATAGGEILCAFYEYGPKEPGGDLLVELCMAISYDRGATFTSRMVLSERPWDPAVDEPLSPGATRGALGWLALS